MQLLLVARKEEDGLPRYLYDRVLALYLQDNVQAASSNPMAAMSAARPTATRSGIPSNPY